MQLSRPQGSGTNPSLVERTAQVGTLSRNPYPTTSNSPDHIVGPDAMA